MPPETITPTSWGGDAVLCSMVTCARTEPARSHSSNWSSRRAPAAEVTRPSYVRTLPVSSFEGARRRGQRDPRDSSVRPLAPTPEEWSDVIDSLRQQLSRTPRRARRRGRPVAQGTRCARPATDAQGTSAQSNDTEDRGTHNSRGTANASSRPQLQERRGDHRVKPRARLSDCPRHAGRCSFAGARRGSPVPSERPKAIHPTCDRPAPSPRATCCTTYPVTGPDCR